MTPMGSNAVYSPLEAFDFDYLSFGLLPLVKNVWAWTAVIAAAISLWRFKAVAVSSLNFRPPTASSPSPPTPPPAPLQDEKALQETKTHASETTPTPAPSPVTTLRPTFDAGEAVYNLVAGTTKKEMFTLYYVTEEKTEKEKDEEEEEEEEDEWRKRWEEVLRTKRGEKLWYRHQQLGGLNGNVVRLWDGNGRFARMS